jgi:hypothetical protein
MLEQSWLAQAEWASDAANCSRAETGQTAVKSIEAGTATASMVTMPRGVSIHMTAL